MTSKKWKGSSCLAFKVPNTDVEIVTFAAGTTLRGVVYNPKKLLSPSPWSGACPHCQQKKQDKKWGKAAMKAVRILRSTKLVPPDGYEWNFSLRYKARGNLNPDGWTITIEQPETDLFLHAIHRNNQPPILIGPVREFRSDRVKLGIELILSGRVPTKGEVETCMRKL